MIEITLFIAFFLFFIGLAIILLRKKLLFILMGIELLINASTLIAIAGSQYWNDNTGQILALIIMIIAGAELAVSLMIIMYCHRKHNISYVNQLNQLYDE